MRGQTIFFHRKFKGLQLTNCVKLDINEDSRLFGGPSHPVVEMKKFELCLSILFSPVAVSAFAADLDPVNHDPSAFEAHILPGMVCIVNSWNPQGCSDRRRLVRDLIRRDFGQAELIAGMSRTPVGLRSRSDNIYGSVSLGLPIALDLPDLFEFLAAKLNPNRPTFLAAPELAAARARLQRRGDPRVGLVFDSEDALIPPLLLAIALDRREMFLRLARLHSGVDFAAVDFRGNNIWHYIAHFGRADLLPYAPMTQAMESRNQAGLSPLEVLHANTSLSPEARESIRTQILGTQSASLVRR